MIFNKNLINQFALCTQRAAFGASKFIGKNDKIAADKAAVDEMRKELNKISIDGKIVIGEGEMDEAPMLYIGEKVGNGKGAQVDIAVDPLEGTNFTAKNLPNAICVMSITKKNNLLNAPDTYMEKIAIGSNLPKNLVDLDYSVKKNIYLLSEAKNIKPEKLTACLLDRPRHKEIVSNLKTLGVKINFIKDGDVLGVMNVGKPLLKSDIFFGIGGAPEGVLAASALSCLDCQMQTRLVLKSDDEISRAKKIGIKDFKKKYYINEMVKGDVVFCATGVTSGDLLNGIKNSNEYFESETFILHKDSKTSIKVKNKIKK